MGDLCIYRFEMVLRINWNSFKKKNSKSVILCTWSPGYKDWKIRKNPKEIWTDLTSRVYRNSLTANIFDSEMLVKDAFLLLPSVSYWILGTMIFVEP